jgi:hypothetical protein
MENIHPNYIAMLVPYMPFSVKGTRSTNSKVRFTLMVLLHVSCYKFQYSLARYLYSGFA